MSSKMHSLCAFDNIKEIHKYTSQTKVTYSTAMGQILNIISNIVSLNKLFYNDG